MILHNSDLIEKAIPPWQYVFKFDLQVVWKLFSELGKDKMQTQEMK